MTRVLVNSQLLSILNNLKEPLELCDEAGRVMGRVFPTQDQSEYEPFVPDFDEEELRRQDSSNEERYTTAEVLAYLEKL